MREFVSDPLELALLDFAHQHGANIAQMNADKENRAGTWISVVL